MKEAHMKKIHRDQAARLCEFAASNPRFAGEYEAIAASLGWTGADAAVNIAYKAWAEAFDRLDDTEAARANRATGAPYPFDVVEAFAATLLREGWSPAKPDKPLKESK